MAARVINILLGIWFFLSTFLWPHHPDQVMNAWACGLLTVAFAAIAISAPSVRWANFVLGIWMILSAWVIMTMSRETIWANVLTGAAVAIVSLFPNTARNESGMPLRPRRRIEV